jgi:hypothetical protein
MHPATCSVCMCKQKKGMLFQKLMTFCCSPSTDNKGILTHTVFKYATHKNNKGSCVMYKDL